MTRELVAVGFGRGLTLRDIKGTGHVWTRRGTLVASPYRRDSRRDDDGIVVEPLSNCGGCLRSVTTSKAGRLCRAAMTRYVRRMRFEKVWVDQCRATRAIKRRFGAKSALDYLIGEKLISFADAARAHPVFARELPKFLAAIWQTFNEYEIAGYVATRKPASRNRLRQLLFLRQSGRCGGTTTGCGRVIRSNTRAFHRRLSRRRTGSPSACPACSSLPQSFPPA
jgi:hypothetical protein